MRLIIRRGSVVHLEADAVVNAANSDLANGGGVAAALEKAAGPEFAKACKDHPHIPEGQAGHTPGFRLRATNVIHAVGPRWSGGAENEKQLLRSAYRSILTVAEQLGVRTLGVVPLSIGIFRYPVEEGCRIAIEELSAAPDSIGTVTLMAFQDHEYQLLRRLHAEVDPAHAEDPEVLRFYERELPLFELTNFVERPVEIDGRTWATSEHYYQAMKSDDPTTIDWIAADPSPHEARKRGQTVTWCASFDRPTVMRRALHAKFTQHADLRALLLGTGDAPLAEASPTDPYWGEGPDGTGQNMLGTLLMELRDELTRPAVAEDPASSKAATPWRKDDIYPVIGFIIVSGGDLDGGWVRRDVIAERLIDDPTVGPIVRAATTSARPPLTVAGNMVDHWSQDFTMGRLDQAAGLQREKIDGKWAYRAESPHPDPVRAEHERQLTNALVAAGVIEAPNGPYTTIMFAMARGHEVFVTVADPMPAWAAAVASMTVRMGYPQDARVSLVTATIAADLPHPIRLSVSDDDGLDVWIDRVIVPMELEPDALRLVLAEMHDWAMAVGDAIDTALASTPGESA